MASTIKVDTIDTPDGTGNITVNRPLSGSGASLTSLPAGNLTGSLPSIDGNALVGISPRNFIINGNMSQHPDGDNADFNGTEYVCALWQALANQDGVIASSQDTSVVPTVAQSNVNSKYSLKLDVTTADTSITAGQYYGLRYHITGSDFALLHQQQVTLAFWVYATKTGTYCCSFQNSATDRSYPVEYTVSSSNTWEYKTITLTLDTSGTWLFTEADKGLTIHWMLASGSTFHGTNATWQAGKYYGTSNQVNALDSTSNNFYLSQVGLYLGSSAPTFTSPPISTILNQLSFYYQSSFPIGTAWQQSFSGGNTVFPCPNVGTALNFNGITMSPSLRATPTITTYNPFAANSSAREVGTANDRAITTNYDSAGGWSWYNNSGVTLDAGMHLHWSADARH